MAGSALRVRDLYSRPGGPAYPFKDDQGQLCWLESLTDEGGRLAIKQQTVEGERVVTPAGFQVRTRVHEYGGKCFCRVGGQIIFNNYFDGVLYRQDLHGDSAPRALSKQTVDISSYADLYFSESLNMLFAIQERVVLAKAEPISQLVAFNLNESSPGDTQIIAQGADFYANPCVSPSGNLIIWQQWQHPHMPWDESALFHADLIEGTGGIHLNNIKQIAGGSGQSVCQSGFLSNDDIVLAMDQDSGDDTPDNYWNLYLRHADKLTPLTKVQGEIGEAHWIFGQRRWVQINETLIYAIVTRDGADHLLELDLKTRAVQIKKPSFASLSQLERDGDTVLSIANYTDKPAEIISVSQHSSFKTEKAQTAWVQTRDVSQPELLSFQTSDGERAYANFFPECGSKSSDSALLVRVHGGPTSRSDMALSPLTQYFCQNGFSVLDINHRGSTGHGRAFRQRLLSHWGNIDADDIADAVKFTVQEKQLDTSRVFIRGGSAGGYAVLRALTRFPRLFDGGACYYGIGNLITLAEITHKFEGYYTDQLIGEKFGPDTKKRSDSRFKTRSPIFEIDKIESPLILFQGLDDKVVPPEVSREMVETLKQNGVAYEYIEYTNEGHGFRKSETKIDALKKEIAFYRKILGLQEGRFC